MSAAVHDARRQSAPRPFDPRFQARLETAIERLIAMLDTIDGDSDLEDEAEDVNEDGDDLDRGEFCEDEAVERWRARLRR